MPILDPGDYTIVWIAPLEIEARAARCMLDNEHQGKFPLSRGDDYLFLPGDMCGHNIVIATLPAGQVYGTASAAALASRIKSFFPNLWFALLIGVAAGLPNRSRDIRLGDVLVALPTNDSEAIVPYDLGKETTGGYELLREGTHLKGVPAVVGSAIRHIKMKSSKRTPAFLRHYRKMKNIEHTDGATFVDPGQDKDVLWGSETTRIRRRARRPEARTRVWYGALGSGDKLIKDAHKRDLLQQLSRDGLIGLEMEAAGTMNQLPVGVIKGVCDYADANKNDVWQPYAAAIASAYAKELLKEVGPGTPLRRRLPRATSTPDYHTVSTQDSRPRPTCTS